MSNVKNENFLTPAQAAKELGISVATLRKYSLIVEHTTDNANYFERNSQNNRLYTSENLEDFKKMVELGHEPKMTLDLAAQKIYPTESTKKDNNNDLEKVVADLKAKNKLQAQKIEELEVKISDLTSANEELAKKDEALQTEVVKSEEKSTELKERVNEQVKDDKKDHWWNRFMK
ncbi:MerR family transcriptional regulator [Companilactobacillus baiquanensis]|uniref:HTH merR-type domain-containing protein n=1 Tax=Companilactobacillus baiquanensis TaxID=2486005 RepID=A0ABW1UW52_9LACO|nr:hypothetical protein [Companilactobacillus baiquanensis]